MKNIRHLYSILILAVGMSGAGLRADTFPQTNTLSGETRISPPQVAVGGMFGQFVSAKSNVFVASYNSAPQNGPDTPIAAVFRKTESGFEQYATLSVPTRAGLTLHQLSTDGNQIAVRILEGDISAIYVFGREQGQWVLQTRTLPSETIWSIAISDGVMVAGAAFKALVFELRNGTWIETKILPPNDIPTAVRNGFGASATVHQGTIIITAVGEIRSDPGRAYVYVRDGDGWRLQAELRPEEFNFVRFGYAVALEEDTALVSTYPNRSNNGTVYLYQRSAGAWTRIGFLPAFEPEEWFGRSVAVSGRNLVVGAPSARGGSGCVYLFRRSGAGFDRLKLYRNDTVHELLSGDSLGFNVAADDNALFFGAPFHDALAQDAGVAFLFRFQYSPALESPWARHEDNSFHFTMVDAKVGETYAIQTSATFETPWIQLKQFVADGQTIQIDVDIPAGEFGFFRVSAPTATTRQGP